MGNSYGGLRTLNPGLWCDARCRSRRLLHLWLFKAGGPPGLARWRNFLQREQESPRSWAVRETGFEKAFSA
jgi:hypothetical protein